MLTQPDGGAALRLLQQPNHVDLEDGEVVLREAGRYAELAALYKHRGRHAEGLALLQCLSQEPAGLCPAPRGAAADLPGLTGVWAAVRYACTAGGESRQAGSHGNLFRPIHRKLTF